MFFAAVNSMPPWWHEKIARCHFIRKRCQQSKKANAFIRWIEEINAKIGLPDKFDVVQDKNIDWIITWVKKEPNPLYSVPVL